MSPLGDEIVIVISSLLVENHHILELVEINLVCFTLPERGVGDCLRGRLKLVSVAAHGCLVEVIDADARLTLRHVLHHRSHYVVAAPLKMAWRLIKVHETVFAEVTL